MGYMGIGVMLQYLGGNAEAANTHNTAKGKVISVARMDEVGDGRLVLGFTDGTAIAFSDEGRSCCESRYMRTDDDLSLFVGATFTGARVLDAPSIEAEYEEHEVQFLHVDTSKGTFTVCTHNEHNGYYGGFAITVSECKA